MSYCKFKCNCLILKGKIGGKVEGRQGFFFINFNIFIPSWALSTTLYDNSFTTISNSSSYKKMLIHFNYS